MSENFKLGMDCKLYFKTALLTGPPDGTGWTEIDNAKDVNLQQENGEADVTTRANNGWRATAATLKEATIEFEMLWKPADAAFAAILAAWLAAGEIAIVALAGENDGWGYGRIHGELKALVTRAIHPHGGGPECRAGLRSPVGAVRRTDAAVGRRLSR